MGESPYGSQVTLLPQGNYLLSCMTVVRDAKSETFAFTNAFENVANILIAAALDLVPAEPLSVMTPTKLPYAGRRQTKPICGVSILRAGASFEGALRRTYGINGNHLSMGKILIQRDEETCLPQHIYSKLPQNIKSSTVLILEPMLATGGSASKAIEILLEHGVAEEDIVFVNLVASKKGLNTVLKKFSHMKLVTAAIDDDLTKSNHIAPGLGDFGDRFYGTN